MKDKLTVKQSADLQEKRNTLYCRIQQWRAVQLAYMPFVASLLLTQAKEPISLPVGEDEHSKFVEHIPLLLPLSILSPLRAQAKHMCERELRLRKAQAEEALEDIRHGRRMITGLTQFKKLNICGAGNKPNTRMHTLYN